MISMLQAAWVASIQALVALVGTWLLAFGLKSVREAGGFDTRKPTPQSWRFWMGLGLLSVSLVGAALTPLATGKSSTAAPSQPASALAAPVAIAPVNARELWQLRSECMRLGVKVLDGNFIGRALAQEQRSHYSLKDGRCYVQLEVHQADLGVPGDYSTYLYDGQTGELVAWTKARGCPQDCKCVGWSQKQGGDRCEASGGVIDVAMQE